MTNRRKYPEEFKKDAVRLMLARGTRTIAEVAAELKLSQSMLHRWHQRYGAEVTGGASQSQEKREDVEQMRRQLRELQQENALLKKAAALSRKK